MMSAVFLSLVVAEVALEHGSAMAAPITLSKVMSDEKLKSQVAEADQAVEADQARLVERQDVAHRCQEVLGVLARAAVPVSFSGEDFKLQEIVAGGNMGRQDLAADLETYRDGEDVLVMTGTH
jgi:hypothetical protein